MNRRSESSYSHKCFENKIGFTNLMEHVTRPIFFARVALRKLIILKMACKNFQKNLRKYIARICISEFRTRQTWTHATFKIATRPTTPGCVANSFVTFLRTVIFSAGLVKHFVLPSKQIGTRRWREKIRIVKKKVYMYDYYESKIYRYVTVDSLKWCNSRFNENAF